MYVYTRNLHAHVRVCVCVVNAYSLTRARSKKKRPPDAHAAYDEHTLGRPTENIIITYSGFCVAESTDEIRYTVRRISGTEKPVEKAEGFGTNPYGLRRRRREISGRNETNTNDGREWKQHFTSSIQT